MARRRKSKIQPAVKTITTRLDKGAYLYADLGQMASVVNRRFYRQGLNWAVSGFTFENLSGATGKIRVNSLPNTWVCSNAWEKAFRAWKKQQDDALDETDQQSIKATYNDFKIFMDEGHSTAGPNANLRPVGSAGALYPAGEWEYSQIVVPNFLAVGTVYEPYIQMLGGGPVAGSPASIGLVNAYVNSRSVPQTPDPALPPGVNSQTENILMAMFDVGDNSDEIKDNAIDKNNDLPYDQDQYPGQVGDQSEFVAVANLGNTMVSTTTNGGNFPCGLIQFDTNSLDDYVWVHIHLVPGTHRGYLCEPMTEM